MSKAEKRAHECYPDDDVASIQSRFGFLLGYQQAERDLALTWEDIREIYCITLNLREHLGASVFGEPLYQEVLKRYKAKKGKSNNELLQKEKK